MALFDFVSDILFGKPPKAPDYAGAAKEQGTANIAAAREQALLNNPNVYTPYGSDVYTDTGPGTRGTRTQTLSPAEQEKLEASNRIQMGSLGLLEGQLPNIQEALTGKFGLPGQAQEQYDPRYAPEGRLQTSVGLGQAGPIQGGLDYGIAPGMPSADAGVRDLVSQSIYDQSAKFLDPQFARRAATQTQDLANQGITRGSAAYDEANRNLDLARESAYGDLANRAVMGGGDALSQLYGLQMAGRQQGVGEITQQGEFTNQAQNQAVQQLIAAMSQKNAGITGQANIAAQQLGAQNAGRAQNYQEYAANRTMPIQMLNALLTGSQVNNPTFGATQPSQIAAAPVYQAAGDTGQYAMDRYGAKQANIGMMMGTAAKMYSPKPG